MAIDANTEIHAFGTKDAIDDGSTSSIASGAISATADITQWTNDDDAVEAGFIGLFNFTVAPDDGDRIAIIARHMDIDGTGDSPVPTATYPEMEIGSFVVKGATGDQILSAEVQLPNMQTSQVYEFYLINQTGVAISANWDLDITPRGSKLHA